MEAKITNSEPDRLLEQFASEPDEERAASILSTLMTEHVMPVVDSVVATAPVGWALEAAWDREDLKSEVVVKLLGRLKEYRAEPGREPLERLLSYVAVSAYNVCHSYLRSKYPERSRLKNSIRYVLKHQTGLAIWEAGARVWLCGLATWRGRKTAPLPAGRLAGLSDRVARPGGPGGADQQRRNPAPLVRAIFELTGAPLEFDDL